MYANHTQSNDGTQGCGDTRTSTALTPNFTYQTAPAVNGHLGSCRPNDVNLLLGSTEVVDGDTVLGDFVAGNRNSLTYYNFYSINDGDWTDPNTWSTVGFGSTINAAASSTDPIVRPFPRRQYDNAIIGNGKKVRLNTNIGYNRIIQPPEINTLAGPSVSIMENGILDLGMSTLRCMAFTANKGATLIVGSKYGIGGRTAWADSGNIVTYQANPFPDIKDSINIIYSAEGYSNRGNSYLSTVPARDGSTHYFEYVAVRQSPSGTILMSNTTLDTLKRATRCINNYLHKKATLTAGSVYYLELNPAGTGSRKYKAWIDYNYDGDWNDAGEEIINFNSSATVNFNTSTFTVPIGTNAGSTLMRVSMSNNTTDYSPTTGNFGEIEDYTIEIINGSTVISQSSGTGLPDYLYSYQIHSPRITSSVNLSKNLIVRDSVKIKSGVLNNGANQFKLFGDFIHDTLNGFNAGSGRIIFESNGNDTIRGSFPITFKAVYNRKSGDSLVISNNIIMTDSLTMDSSYNIKLDDSKVITFNNNSNANFFSPTGTFYNKKMVVVSGNNNSGTITKQFTNTGGAANPKTFLYPVGIDTVYNSFYFRDTSASYVNPSLTVKLRKGLHPNSQGIHGLKKYWQISASGISNNLDTMLFTYHHTDTSGNVNRYVPAIWGGTAWEINLGLSPYAKVSPIRFFINPSFVGDFTAAEKEEYFEGRIFYSLNSGNWNDPANWSNVSHLGPTASYYPGQIYDKDTVNVDGHTMLFNVDSVLIDSLRIGGTNPSPSAGIVRFASSPSIKTMNLRTIFLDADNGILDGDISGNRKDTINIIQNFRNLTTGRVSLDTTGNNFTLLKFKGNTDSKIIGNGNWGSLNRIIIAKDDGLLDTLENQSNSLGSSTSISPNLLFDFQSGVLKQTGTNQLYLSGDSSGIIAMNPYTGISLLSGSIASKTTLQTNSNTTVYLNGGDLNIGNGINEHLLYKTGSKFDLINGNLIVAGTFSRYQTNSACDFNMAFSGIVKVNSIGNSDSTKIGFDLSNSNSTFNLTGGRVIIANANGSNSSLADFKVNSSIGSMTGGVIQCGDSILTPNNTIIKLAGIFPINILHGANNPANSVTTKLSEEFFTILNEIKIDNNHTFTLNGNTLFLKGNLTNYGIFQGAPSAPTTSPWQLVLNDSLNQTIFNNNVPGIELYNLSLNKSNGVVNLSALGNSNLIIRNNLEFTTDNLSFINANLDTSNYVELSSAFSSNPNILRSGKGHVYGTIKRWIKNGAQSLLFTVGADTLDSYRPLTFDTYDNDNTPGLISVTGYSENHPDFPPALVNSSNNIQRYWNVETNGFALGTNRSFGVTTQWVRPRDTIGRNNPNPLFFKHFVRTPAYPTAGTWAEKFTPTISDSTVKSTGNINFGDFIVGEPAGQTFYSRNNGSWFDVNNWSITSYYVDDPPSRIPNQSSDIVRIGNNKTIDLPEAFADTVKSVYIEKDQINKLPGRLNILGSLGFVRGTTFVLEDGCTIGLQNLVGLTQSGLSGAVQTDVRSFGVSRYVYMNNQGSQNTGQALPDSIQCLIVDNPSNINKSVFLNTPTGNIIKVRDTLLVQQGTLNVNNRNLKLFNVMYLDTVINNGIINPAPITLTWGGNNDKYAIINNRTGLTLNSMDIDGGTLTIDRSTNYNVNLQHLRISNLLTFQNPSSIILGNGVNLNITNSNPNSIVNYGTDRYIRTSSTSGLLIRDIIPSATYFYPIASFNKNNSIINYSPATFITDASGVNGRIGIRTSPGSSVALPGGHKGLANSSAAEYLERYWAVDSVTAQINGKLQFNYNESEIFGTETNLTVVGKWNPPYEKTPGSWVRPTPILNYPGNLFESPASYSYLNLSGDWTIGNESAFRRIFRSRMNGLWSDFNSWTYDPSFSGPIAGVGIYPNNMLDSVEIGGNHEITLDSNFAVGGTTVGLSNLIIGTLNLQINILSGDYFNLSDNSTLKTGHPLGFSTLGNNFGSIQTTLGRFFGDVSVLGNFEYNGSNNQITGSGLPSKIRNLIINNNGSIIDNTVLLSNSTDIEEDVNIQRGKLDISNLSISKSAFGGNFNIASDAYIRLGNTNNVISGLNNYANYNIDFNSYFEFYSTAPDNQDISLLPANWITGYGNVNSINSGIKYVNSAILINGDLNILNSSTLWNNVGVNSLEVRGNINNCATLNNNGKIEIGN